MQFALAAPKPKPDPAVSNVADIIAADRVIGTLTTYPCRTSGLDATYGATINLRESGMEAGGRYILRADIVGGGHSPEEAVRRAVLNGIREHSELLDACQVVARRLGIEVPE